MTYALCGLREIHFWNSSRHAHIFLSAGFGCENRKFGIVLSIPAAPTVLIKSLRFVIFYKVLIN